ncbi:MAG: hypothetical protein KL787_09445 [Taibaiella sp.]|nr:hypothetical protein [Taibaiella sp.]
MKKLLIYGTIFLLSALAGFAQVRVAFPTAHIYGKGFEEAVQNLLQAYDTKDEKAFKQFVHPEHQLMYQYRIGVPYVLSLSSEVHFDELPPAFLPYDDFELDKKGLQAQFEPLPEFDCDLEDWNKKGLYIASVPEPVLAPVIEENFKFENIDQESRDMMIRHVALYDKNYVALYLTTDGASGT